MLKSLITCACLALFLAACAPVKPAPDKSAQAAVKPPAGCVAQTGTMIKTAPNACTAFGNTYTREDIDRTGYTTLGGALRQLDPSVSVGH